jgi:murein DD-endopeptidase MepM/ murein hydrolase activator NlpD
VPGFYRVSSGFGYRIHPIFGTRKMHTGIDVGRNLNPPKSIDGAPIVAAGTGTVVSAGWRNGYGNTVVIDHGNGVATLYAHQPSGGIKVAAGQRVGKGDRIGTVGSTGYSTGPHLHFEVRVNGDPVDPMKYLR